MHFHCYADDTQLVLNVQPNKSEFMDQDCLVKLQNCLSDINDWMHHHFLKLNINETDVMEICLYRNSRVDKLQPAMIFCAARNGFKKFKTGQRRRLFL